ncbi:T9SS type B sorting domain-containing protein [Robertkochia aurantiaca]|uniref:T9SS type B sorting domain-containing protein n=1 Tax=Robertkochia aurantiaca TaxID=2873700 RepID=UPI001CCAEA42|nr:T9SS type B sorting domain-containing protein [Robertkochia sp. 3YJGBD-33]
MQRFLLLFILPLLLTKGMAQENCTSLLTPLDGSSQVAINTTLQWSPVTGVNGYIISIGTQPGVYDIVNNRSLGLATSFTPPTGLPANTTIYVRISLFLINSATINCPEESFTTGPVDFIPDCNELTIPADGAEGVQVNASLNWEYAVGATGYLLSYGTSPAANEIEGGIDVGNVLRYEPPANLPENTTIYVRITPYNDLGQATSCNTFNFTTKEFNPIPECTSLITPQNGEVGVSLSPIVQWNESPGAEGYRLTMGTTPFVADILDNVDFGDVTETPVIDFLPNTTVFVIITPYNAAGEALDCIQESFSTAAGCGPFLDPETGDLTDRNPELNFPDRVVICSNGPEESFSAGLEGDQVNWYFLEDGQQQLIADNSTVIFEEEGRYRVEVTRQYLIDGEEFQCSSEKEFEVVRSELPLITDVEITDGITGRNVTVTAVGAGTYEYSLNAPDGPFQGTGTFLNIETEGAIIYVRDINGCGLVEIALLEIDFPKFFTPNNDGINDLWKPLFSRDRDIILERVAIFDRFGKLLFEIDERSAGWDGTLEGRALPSADYWYLATYSDDSVKKGHFSLKR